MLSLNVDIIYYDLLAYKFIKVFFNLIKKFRKKIRTL